MEPIINKELLSSIRAKLNTLITSFNKKEPDIILHQEGIPSNLDERANNTSFITSKNVLYQKTIARLIDIKNSLPSNYLTKYTGVVINVADYPELVTALATCNAYDIIKVTQDIVGITSIISITKPLKFTAASKEIKVSGAISEGPLILNASDDVLITGITIEITSGGSNDSCIHNSLDTAENNLIYDCNLKTNEFGIKSVNKSLRIQNNTFTFIGTADSHRFIGIYAGGGGDLIISNNTFSGHTSTQIISILATIVNTNFYISNNTSGIVQRMLMCDVNQSEGANNNIYSYNNSITTNSGYYIFYSENPLRGFSNIIIEKDKEILNTGALSKGAIGLDASSTGIANSNCNINLYSFTTSGELRSDYTDGSVEKNKSICYSTAKITLPQEYTTALKYLNFGKLFLTSDEINSLIAEKASKETQSTSDPTVDFDVTAGYSVNSQHWNIITKKNWICENAAKGAAVWVISNTGEKGDKGDPPIFETPGVATVLNSDQNPTCEVIKTEPDTYKLNLGIPRGESGSGWLSDYRDPFNTEGKDNDYWLNKTTNEYFQKIKGTWNKQGNIKGSRGDSQLSYGLTKQILSQTLINFTSNNINSFYIAWGNVIEWAASIKVFVWVKGTATPDFDTATPTATLTGNAQSYTYSGATAGQTYYVSVYAYGVPTYCKKEISVGSYITNLLVDSFDTNTGTTANLSWTAWSGAYIYKVKYNLGLTENNPTEIETANTSQTITGLTKGAVHWFKVEAYDNNNNKLAEVSYNQMVDDFIRVIEENGVKTWNIRDKNDITAYEKAISIFHYLNPQDILYRDTNKYSYLKYKGEGAIGTGFYLIQSRRDSSVVCKVYGEYTNNEMGQSALYCNNVLNSNNVLIHEPANGNISLYKGDIDDNSSRGILYGGYSIINGGENVSSNATQTCKSARGDRVWSYNGVNNQIPPNYTLKNYLVYYPDFLVDNTNNNISWATMPAVKQNNTNYMLQVFFDTQAQKFGYNKSGFGSVNFNFADYGITATNHLNKGVITDGVSKILFYPNLYSGTGYLLEFNFSSNTCRMLNNAVPHIDALPSVGGEENAWGIKLMTINGRISYLKAGQFTSSSYVISIGGKIDNPNVAEITTHLMGDCSCSSEGDYQEFILGFSTIGEGGIVNVCANDRDNVGGGFLGHSSYAKNSTSDTNFWMRRIENLTLTC